MRTEYLEVSLCITFVFRERRDYLYLHHRNVREKIKQEAGNEINSYRENSTHTW